MRHPKAPSIGQAGDVIWEARGNDASSAPTSCCAPARKASRWLPPIANCLYRRSRMVEEWVVRDGLAHALYRGLDPERLLATKAFRGYTGSLLRPRRQTSSP